MPYSHGGDRRDNTLKDSISAATNRRDWQIIWPENTFSIIAVRLLLLREKSNDSSLSDKILTHPVDFV